MAAPVVATGKGRTHHVRLGDDGFILTPVHGQPQFVTSLEPALAPQQYISADGLHHTAQHPERNLVWAMETFHGGGLQYRDGGQEPVGKYNESSGIDVNEPGEVGLANRLVRQAVGAIDEGSADLDPDNPGLNEFTANAYTSWFPIDLSSRASIDGWDEPANMDAANTPARYAVLTRSVSSYAAGYSESSWFRLDPTEGARCASIMVRHPTDDFTDFHGNAVSDEVPGVFASGTNNLAAGSRILTQTYSGSDFSNAWRGRTITVTVDVAAASTGLNNSGEWDGTTPFELFVEDSAGVSVQRIEFGPSGNVGRRDWQAFTVSLDINASATWLRYGIRSVGYTYVLTLGSDRHRDREREDSTWNGRYSEYPHIFVDNARVTLGEAVPATYVPSNMIPFRGCLYGAFGNRVYEYNPSTEVWTSRLTAPGDDLFNGLGYAPQVNRLLAGYGAHGSTTSGGYYYTNNGADWTQSSYDNVADRVKGPFASIGDRIWGIVDKRQLASAEYIENGTGPLGAAWTNYDVAGWDQRLTSLYAVNDTVVAGALGGLYIYQRVANGLSEADRFRNVVPEIIFSSHPDNFARGAAFLGQLYLPLRYGMVRTNGINTYEELTHLLHGQRLTAFGGKILSITADSHIGYILMEAPATHHSPGTWLMSFDVDTELGLVHIRPLHFIAQDTLYNMAVFTGGTSDVNTEHDHTYLFISGLDSARLPVVYRMQVPSRHESHSRDTEPDLIDHGYLYTSWWDGGFPNEYKFIKLVTFETENTSDTQTISVDIETEDNLYSPDSLAAVATNGRVTAGLADQGIKAKRLRLRLRLASDSRTAGPRIICPIEVHTTFRPRRLRNYTFTVQLGPQRLLNDGYDHTTAAAAFNTLHAHVNSGEPVTLYEDEDGDGEVTEHQVFIDDVQYWQSKEGDTPSDDPLMVYRVSAIEVSPP